MATCFVEYSDLPVLDDNRSSAEVSPGRLSQHQGSLLQSLWRSGFCTFIVAILSVHTYVPNKPFANDAYAVIVCWSWFMTFSSDLCVTGALSDGRLCRRLAPAQPDASACRFLLWEVRSHWGGAQFPTLNPTTTIFCFIFTLQIIGSLMIKIQSFFLLVQSLPSLRFLGILSEWVFDNNTGGKKMAFFGLSPK